jgi:Icc protein
MKSLLHLSDLHTGKSAASDLRLEIIRDSVLELRPDVLVITGDVLHRGKASERRQFEKLFSPLLERPGTFIVPGNHDRVGEGAGADFMNGERVRVDNHEGLFLVRVDSTGQHNRSFFVDHGDLCTKIIGQIIAAFQSAGAARLGVSSSPHPASG